MSAAPLVSSLPSGTLVRYRTLGAALRARGEHDAADAILELTEMLRSVDAALVSEHESALRMAKVVREKNAQLSAAEVEKTGLALTVIEAASAVPRWIPVEEGLPEPMGPLVLAAYHGGHGSTLALAYHDGSRWLLPDGRPRDSVFLWQPIPEPPEPKP